MNAQREHFGRGLISVFVMVGLAVGLGNVWRFPYMMGRYGGGAFLLLYIVALAAIGVPALMAEWTLGRATGKGPPAAYVTAGLPGGKIAGGLLFLTVLMATSYYVVVLGWVILYMVWALAFGFAGTDPSSLFRALGEDVLSQVAATWSVVLGCGFVLTLGVRKGIARVSSFFVPIFFLLLLLLVIRSLSLPGAGEGLSYMFTFDAGTITPQTLLAVVGQAAFSLGLGGTFMVLYGAYLRPDASIPFTAVQTALGDLSASMLAALLVIPAVFAAGLQLDSGPPLLFETLPVVFAGIAGGDLLAAIFFLALGLVAFLSAVAAIEALIEPISVRATWNRGQAIWAVTTVIAVLAIPSMLSVEYLTKSDLIWGSTMQPVGSVLALLAVGWSIGRGRALAVSGLAEGRLGRLWVVWIRYVVPAVVLMALIAGWVAG